MAVWGLFLLCLGLAAPAPVAAQNEALPDFTQIVEEHGEAVVNISTTQKVQAQGAPNLPPQFEGTPFEDFFRRFFGETPQREFETHSLGSGFIISSDGYVVTNAHVIKDATEIVVQLTNRQQFEAEVVGRDEALDVALLKVDAQDLPTVKAGDPDDLEVGEWVVAIGSPFGFENSVTAGIVSAKGRSLPTDNYVNFIQTDVAVNPGNSGGPLFSMAGKVVGINAQIYSQSGGFMGLSFAIPIDIAMDAVQQLKEYGKVRRGWLGVYIQDVSPELAESFGMKKPVGALVARVVEGSPAAGAGLQSGDVVVAVNGEEIRTSGDLPPKIGRLKPGTEVTLTVMRGGEQQKIQVTVGSQEKAQRAREGQPQEVLGMRVRPVPPEAREELGLPEGQGVQVAEVTGDPARSAGVRSGDIILKLGNEPVKGPASMSGIASELPSGRAVPMLVRRGQGALFLPIQVP
ncbi:DegQ family serine endoprotease [Thiohalorhabdus methylotrophus]|uniref:Probable periplasmic serine endoprotease DegP-like n=1 Tax=Thiohalorhabdus methylotrophus TaxID=3242694 RepID=A0ABV4TWL9_9GAMM